MALKTVAYTGDFCTSVNREERNGLLAGFASDLRAGAAVQLRRRKRLWQSAGAASGYRRRAQKDEICVLYQNSRRSTFKAEFPRNHDALTCWAMGIMGQKLRGGLLEWHRRRCQPGLSWPSDSDILMILRPDLNPQSSSRGSGSVHRDYRLLQATNITGHRPRSGE